MPLTTTSTPEEIAEYVDALVRESEQDSNRQSWLAEADDALNFYLGDQWDTTKPEGQERVVLNRVQNCVISLVAIQASDPPKATFTPRESGEPPLVYLNTDIPDFANLASLPMAAQILSQIPDPSQPIPLQFVAYLQQIIEQNNVIAFSGMVPGVVQIDPHVLAEVSDQTAAEALQTIFDGMWEGSDCQRVFVENVSNKNILGWQPSLYDFDDDAKKHVVTNVHPKQVFIDPLNTDSSTWQYAVFDQPVSADEAKSKWPHLAQKIDEVADTGQIRPAGSNNYNQAAMYDQQFERAMVNVRTAWLRFQPYPMSPDDAIGKGFIAMADVPTGEMELAADEMGQAVFDPITNQPAYKPVTRQAMVDADGAEVSPAAPGWPMRYGIRQMTVVAGIAVDDRECEHADIPLPTNRNIPIPFSPYGQGEPKRLKELQQAINEILSAYVTHFKYNAFPPECLPQSVIDRLDTALQKGRSRPGQRIGIPDDLIQQFGDIKKILGTLDVAQMPPDFWQLLNLLIELIDREGNQAEVMQGNASATWSGETVKALQTAANQIIQGKSLFTEFYVKRLTRLMVHSIINRMSPADWRKYVSKYPVQAIEALHSRAKMMDVDISIEIRSASGASKQAQTQQLVAAKQSGLPVSTPTLLERMDLDPDAEQTRELAYLKRSQQMQQSLQPQPLAANNEAEAGQPATQEQQVTTG